ncbi:hypothetical protein [Bacillus marasmi]|uniref:hypothetical protein n=1 Tax=Bacillus marasmi TaxID=1926279 RepID=UPI0011CC68AE|nr:hypothetical protein [Bacillus marasmi]
MLRMIWGLFFLGSSVFNLTYTFSHPEFFEQFSEYALFNVYAVVIEKLVVPYAEIFTVLLVLFELFVGVFVLGKNNFVKVGLYASLVFTIVLIPVIPPYTYTNIVTAIVPIYLLRKQYPNVFYKDFVNFFHHRGA